MDTDPLHHSSNTRSEEYVISGEILRQRSSVVFDLDKDGFSALHVAAAEGQVEMVRTILGIDKKLCRMKGKDGKTPLHVATIRGQIDVIRELVLSCVDCLEDDTVQGQTALHLAVVHHGTEAAIAIVELIIEMNRIDMLNKKDEQGNTALHLATWRKNRKVIEVLVQAIPEGSRCFEVNVLNKMGLSAVDLLLMFPSEAGDREIYEKLIEAGAQRGRDVGTSNVVRTTSTSSEARSALLVVVSLVATATFQASLTPPGGTWQDSSTPLMELLSLCLCSLTQLDLLFHFQCSTFSPLGSHCSSSFRYV